MKRRDFVQKIALGSLLFSQLRLVSACADPTRKWVFKRSGIPPEMAHILRSKPLAVPENVPGLKYKHLIIGAGISGLSTAYHLHKSGEKDFLILEMETQIGGNSQSGETKAGKFPQGAHYLPIQNLDNQPLLDFLQQTGSISHFSHDGIPYYNELELCHAPEDRLFIYGKWHAGIVESLVQLFPGEKPVWDRFFSQMDQFRNYQGTDGKDVFYIPQRLASKDHDLLHLDQITFAQYLTANEFRSPSLDWYLNYCCRDDYGQDSTHVSAFAGIHYFAARKAVSKNAPSDALLTWPEGNAFLAQQLGGKFPAQIRTNTIVQSIRKTKAETYEVQAFNWQTKETFVYEAQNIVLAVPRHIRPYLLAEIQQREWLLPTHQPWCVVTVELEPFSDYSGAQLAWDNVIFGHQTLGYIHNLNQQVKRPNGNTLLTFYQPLDQAEAKATRHTYLRKSDDALKQEILKDLRSIYPEIENHICYMEVRLWGHGMVSPGINYVTNEVRKAQQQPIDGKIYFAHTDDIGFSLFEEAFDIGYGVANQLLKTQRDVDPL